MRLAEAAASVSHDGAAVHAAKVRAAMEAEAFGSKDVDPLSNTGLWFSPSGSILATLIADVRRWLMSDRNWEETHQRIEDQYWYDRYGGLCCVDPNYGILVMALMYAGDDFHEAMHIINTCAWNTDSNSGILGCLVAIMYYAWPRSSLWRAGSAECPEFQLTSPDSLVDKRVLVEQWINAHTNTPGLAIRISQFTDSMSPIEITTPTFAPQEVPRN